MAPNTWLSDPRIGVIIIDKGLTLYQGVRKSNPENQPEKDPFRMTGIRKLKQYPKDLRGGVYVSFFTESYSLAYDYSNCSGSHEDWHLSAGWVHRFTLQNPMIALSIPHKQWDNVLEDMGLDFLETEEIASSICGLSSEKGEINAIVRINGQQIEEIGICQPEKFLKYQGSQKCIGHKKIDPTWVLW